MKSKEDGNNNNLILLRLGFSLQVFDFPLVTVTIGNEEKKDSETKPHMEIWSEGSCAHFSLEVFQPFSYILFRLVLLLNNETRTDEFIYRIFRLELFELLDTIRKKGRECAIEEDID